MRLHRERPRKGDPLLLSTGKLQWVGSDLVLKSNTGQRLVRKAQVSFDAEMGEKIVALEYDFPMLGGTAPKIPA